MALRFQKLTRPNLRKLPAGQKIAEHGIEFERLHNGDGRYTMNVMVDGQRIHRVIGTEAEGVTRDKVEKAIEQLRTDARHGRLNLPKGRKTILTFEKAAASYIEKLKQVGGKDIPAKERRLKQFLTPFFHQRPLNQISTFDVERYKNARNKDGAANATINRELAVLSHLINKALEWRWMNNKPAMIRRLKEDSGKIVYLTTEQVVKLKEAAKKDQNYFIYPFVVIACGTGMRRNEILRIRLENIRLAQRTIYIPEAKAGARNQPMTEEVVLLLEDMVKQASEGQEWLFSNIASASGHYYDVRKAFRRSVTRAGLDPDVITPHTLRHTFITHAVQAGIDLPTVKRLSGHKTLAMVERYSHQNGQHIQQAMERVEQRLKNIASVDTVTQELHRQAG